MEYNMNNIQHYRELAGLTQTELAAAIKMSQATISRAESGEREPRRKTYEKIQSVLADHGVVCSVPQLMGYEKPSPRYELTAAN
jgi:transcriptional regulator with XRE-family HTH domain